jgi:osmotically inducible protein OsmC
MEPRAKEAAMGISKASAQWDGDIKTGRGVMRPAHADDVPFSLGSRFEGQPASNPEELIGGAFAGCFSMALSLGLEQAGAKPRSIRTTADVKVEKVGAGFTITSIALATEVEAEGIDEAKFKSVAEETKRTCPVARALAGVPTVTLSAKLVRG